MRRSAISIFGFCDKFQHSFILGMIRHKLDEHPLGVKEGRKGGTAQV